MIHRKFGAQWTNGLGGDVTNVFVRKFKIAKNLVRWIFMVLEAN